MARNKTIAAPKPIPSSAPCAPQPTASPELHAPSSVPPIPAVPDAGEGQPKPPTENDLYSALFESLDPSGTEEKHRRRDEVFGKYLASAVQAHEIAQRYNVVLIHDQSSMIRSHADRVYTTVSGFKERKPLLLVLYSTGGSIGSAYLITMSS